MSIAVPKRKAFCISLDLRSGVPVYRQIIDQVTGGIAAGALTPGDQLPTVRQLAVDLSINPNTVIRAYRELEIRGVLETEQGTGTFISQQKVRRDDAERQRSLNQLIGDFVARAGSAGLWNSEKNQVPGIAMALFVIFGGAGLGLTAVLGNRLPLVVGLVLGAYLLFSIKVADQWEKVAVLRLRYLGLRGPGWFHMIPIVDTLSRFVDQRVRTANVTAESTPTRDTVPVNVDAIVFWMVWNAEKSILEVQDFVQAITMSAQTGKETER